MASRIIRKLDILQVGLHEYLNLENFLKSARTNNLQLEIAHVIVMHTDRRLNDKPDIAFFDDYMMVTNNVNFPDGYSTVFFVKRSLERKIKIYSWKSKYVHGIKLRVSGYKIKLIGFTIQTTTTSVHEGKLVLDDRLFSHVSRSIDSVKGTEGEVLLFLNASDSYLGQRATQTEQGQLGAMYRRLLVEQRNFTIISRAANEAYENTDTIAVMINRSAMKILDPICSTQELPLINNKKAVVNFVQLIQVEVANR